jgi:AcrR family transcriptional regulator
MTRVRKDPEVRQAELMDAALELFISAGYEKTMVADIVKKAGVAKGTFFYYFPTKEAVLVAICRRWATELAASFQLQSRELTALKKLQSFIFQLSAPAQVDLLIDKLLSEKQFNFVYTIWQEHVEKIFTPLLTDIIKQGNQERTMHVDYIKETAVFFWSTLDCVWDTSYVDEPEETLITKTKIAESVLKRILGMEENSFELSIFQD